jgi:hypothetical protein
MALREDPKSAMLPFGVVQEFLGLSRSAVLERVKDGRLICVRVDTGHASWRGVTLASLEAYERARPNRGSDAELTREVLRMISVKLRSTDSRKAEDATLSYGEVMEPLGFSWRNPKDRSAVDRLLDEMSTASRADPNQGFMVSAVIVRKANGRPGPRFYLRARELGLLRDGSDENAFWLAQVRAIRSYYSRLRGQR